MMTSIRKLTCGGVLAALILALSPLAVQAQSVFLNNSTTDTSTVWFITGEASLVMNGFDLRAANLVLPVAIERVSISVARPTPGNPVEIVVYEDATGGSPVDATLAGRAQADISEAGVFRYDFETPVVVNQPVVWVGFYLPVDFRFRADTSGASVLTYWGWTANARFDLANLSSAAVLGPADGSTPVNINMGGVARITAQARSTSATQAATTGGVVQIVGSSTVDLSPMVEYPECEALFFDRDDVGITLQDSVKLYCQRLAPIYAPKYPTGYDRRGDLYDVYVFGDTLSATRLKAQITHCIRPPAEDISNAVVGLAAGIPRQWRLLTTVRYGDLVCAELDEVGLVTYFVPGVAPLP